MARNHPPGKVQPDKSSLQFLFKEDDPLPLKPVREEDIIRYAPGDAAKARAQIRDGYIVVLENGEFERELNPSELLRLKLPKVNAGKTYHSIQFKGKKGTRDGGIIVPSDAMHYLLSLHDTGEGLSPAYIKLVLNKLGFESREEIIHQNSPLKEQAQREKLHIHRLMLWLKWNTTLAVNESRDPSLRKLFFNREHPLLRPAFLLLSIAIFILLPILSLDAGLSGDDEKHYQHAAKVYRYFTEEDQSALNDPKYKLNYYGQSFDFFTYLIIKWFGLEDQAYEARHVMVAITGAAAILFTALLVKLFSGYLGGILALLLMFLSPRFLGHAFNNPMDVPFALGNIFTLYFLVLFLRKLPRISIRDAAMMALGIAWTNGIRIGGLLLIPYIFLFAGLYLLVHKWPWKFFSAAWWRFALKGLGILVLISLSGYILSLLTWPYALQDVVNHPIKSFQVMSNIQVSIRVMYDGLIQWSDHLPWHYIPRNIFKTVPAIILMAFFASALSWIYHQKGKQVFWYFILWFTVLFPLIFIVIRESNVYGGWRHMMFIYPSILALAAMTLSTWIKWGIEHKGRKWISWIAGALVLAGLIHPLLHVIRNHPNTYIYFNEWAGGINKTYGNYETDYYANSLRPASDYFLEHILPEHEATQDKPLRVASNFNISYYFRKHRDQALPFYTRYYDRGKYDWDYAILYCNYIHPYQLKNGLWPPKNTIHEIRVDSVVVAAIVERKSRADHYGSTLLKEAIREHNEEKMAQAQNFMEAALVYDPNNEISHLELANCYTARLNFDMARKTMDHLVEIYPDYDKALNLKGYSYLVEAEYSRDKAKLDEAIRWINMAVKSNYKFFSGYYNLGLCYGLLNDLDNAEYNFRQAIRYNGKFAMAYEKLADVYEVRGDLETAKMVRQKASTLR